MSRSLSKLSSLALLACLSTNVMASTSTQYTFKNQRGSVMSFTMQEHGDNAGSISGTFTTAVGNCQIEVGKPMPITGFYSGNALSLSVNYPKCKKTIAMTGHLSQDKTELNTLWLVAEESTDPKGKHWNANIVGSDAFKQIN